MIYRMYMVNRIVDYIKKQVLSKFGLYNAQSSQNALMKQYGLEILEIFHNVSEELNKPIWLEFGTLLGAYRNHSFISYDYDMDLGMYSDQYDIDFENSLIEKGFRKKHFFYQYRKDCRFLTEVTWEYKGFQVDIFLCFKENDTRHIFCYDKQDEVTFSQNKWMFREYCLPDAYPIEKVELSKFEYNSPADPRKCLETYYGSSFMTPIADWIPEESSKRFKTWSVDKAYGSITIVR